MAKASINTGATGQAVHTRTTSDSVETPAAVLVIDGSDDAIPADSTLGLAVYMPASTVGGGATLPAGTEKIGKIEIVDGVAAGTAGNHLGKAEDTPHGGGNTGVFVLAVRNDSRDSLVDTDGDYAPFQVDEDGYLLTAIADMPGAARTTDSISAALATDKVMEGLTELTPKFFSESVAASDTDEELVALVASKKIRVLALVAQCGGTATDMTFESGGSTRKHKIPAGANGGQVLPFNPAGWFETAAGENLTVTTGTGSTCEISGTYVEAS